MRNGGHADEENDLDAAEARSCEKHPAAVVGIKGGRTTAASGQARIMSFDEFVKRSLFPSDWPRREYTCDMGIPPTPYEEMPLHSAARAGGVGREGDGDAEPH
ncbi:hypothetical protein LTR56_020163 [Elasticomyces elasticus]|nr:hypothetical protein LTR56_020163 [Elasticomyces elasticus]KAK3663588.1 hypothetical protein LTR22_005528 [Elasticomyces elasticus]KAK4921707.1 hypothetical protein LTR49_010813 [Elasticomyces elasticus]KAK5741977.1 hypothetical protein LTS12_024418 [Elasticomyces elasticus]